MGRAERRLTAKREKKTSTDVKRAVNNARSFDIEALMTCFALSERRLYGFGRKRILRSVKYISELMDDILTDKATLDDYKRELEEKAKVKIQVVK